MKQHWLAIGLAMVAAAAVAACTATDGTEARPSPSPTAPAAVAVTPPPTLTADTGSGAPTRPERGSTLSPSETVTFCEPVDDVELLMDIYYPPGHTAESNAPAIVYVHGGGWTTGTRTAGEGVRYFQSLLAEGFVIFAVDYRLSPEYLFPAHIQDVQCGVRHIRANAETYGIDPDRIGAIGGSAGGQLVNLLGTAEDGDFEIVGGYDEYSSDVSVVVSLFGASDFSDPNIANHNDNHTQVFGTADPESDELQAASAVKYISSDDATFLILHGENDPVVPITQSEIFSTALEAAGVDVTFVTVENAGHGFSPSGGTPNPSAPELIVMVAEFFSAEL